MTRSVASARLLVCGFAAAALIAVTAVIRARMALPDFAFAGISIAAIVVLAGYALLLSRSVSRLDLSMVAEITVALGIFSLIAGVSATLFSAIQVLFGQQTVEDLSALDVGRIVKSFSEGLAAAAVAPMLAALLRGVEASKAATDEEGGMTEALYRAAELANEITRVTASFGSAASQLEKGAKRFQDAAESAAASASQFGGTVKSEADELRDRLRDLQNEVKAFLDATEAGRSGMTALAGTLKDLPQSAKETDHMLKALAALIDSCTRFVKP